MYEVHNDFSSAVTRYFSVTQGELNNPNEMNNFTRRIRCFTAWMNPITAGSNICVFLFHGIILSEFVISQFIFDQRKIEHSQRNI